jgi:hypothetical protein
MRMVRSSESPLQALRDLLRKSLPPAVELRLISREIVPGEHSFVLGAETVTTRLYGYGQLDSKSFKLSETYCSI